MQIPDESCFFSPLQSAFVSTLRAKALRGAGLGALSLILLAGSGGRASAQSACAQLGVDCSHHGGNNTPDTGSGSGEPRPDPIAVWAERIRQMKARAAQRAAEKKIRDAPKIQAKQAAKAAADARRQDEADAKQRLIDAQRDRDREVERQRLAALEAQKRQAAFDALKPGVVASLKGTGGTQPGPIVLGLKGVDDAKLRWDAKITDPAIVPHARKLASVVPPLPISEKEANFTFDQIFTSAPYRKYEEIYLGNDRLQNTADLVLAGWEVAGVLGEKVAAPLHVVVIFGKTFIAGEDGAYMHLVKNEHDYEMASSFLKDPKRAQEFARIVDDVRNGHSTPPGADPLMVQAARAITDPNLSKSGAAMAWGAMGSPEAVAAMLRKFTFEVVGEAVGEKVGEGIGKLTSSKQVYELVSAERSYAAKMMAETANVEQLTQWKAVIDKSNQLLSTTYKVQAGERVANAVSGKAIGAATDAIANFLMGSTESDGPHYGPPEKETAPKKNALGLKTE